MGAHLRDDLKVAAPFTSRWALAAAQAVALVEALVASGLPTTRLTAVAFGDVDEPESYDGPAQLAPGDNSLIEIALVPTFEEVPPPR